MHDHHSHNHNHHHAHAHHLHTATTASVIVAVTLITIKAIAYMMTNSVSILGTLMDSAIDFAVSVGNFFAIRHALRPADKEHRFGHGKAEALAGLAQSVVIIASACFLLREAYEHFMDPHPPHHTMIGVGLMILCSAITLALVAYQTNVVKKTNSVAIKADSLHYKTDLLVNIGVIITLLISVHHPLIDPIMYLIITLYIVYSAFQIMYNSAQILMDRELGDDVRETIKKIVADNQQIHSMHGLRTRSSGPQKFIEMHVEMDPGITLKEAHVIAEDIVQAIRNVYPDAEVMIHQDPLGECQLSDQKKFETFLGRGSKS